MLRYRCPLCGITSAPYLTQLGANKHGEKHRHERHGGDHPDGEHLVEAAAFPAPRGGEWTAVLVVLVLLGIGLVSKFG